MQSFKIKTKPKTDVFGIFNDPSFSGIYTHDTGDVSHNDIVATYAFQMR